MNELYLYGKRHGDKPGGIFQAILDQSATIKGNYHVSPNFGHDLNTGNLDEYLKGGRVKEYPVAVCMPPRGNMVDVTGGQVLRLEFQLFFLTLDKRNQDGTLKDEDDDAYASHSTPPDDWAQMRGVALDFISMFRKMRESYLPKYLPHRSMFQTDFSRAVTIPITRRGVDVYNGVSLSFSALLVGEVCFVNDYGDEVLVELELPEIL